MLWNQYRIDAIFCLIFEWEFQVFAEYTVENIYGVGNGFRVCLVSAYYCGWESSFWWCVTKFKILPAKSYSNEKIDLSVLDSDIAIYKEKTV